MNFIQIAGFLGADAEVRHTASGKRVISMRVATKTRQAGKDETIWWRVNVWGDRFDKLLPYLKKGSPVIILGELGKPEVYVDKAGISQVSLTITAEMIKFSPFGRPEKVDTPAMSSPSSSFSSDPFSGGVVSEELVGYAASKGQGDFDDSFSNEELPF